MLAWRSCKRMFKSQRKCNINCNVGMNMLTLCEFLVFYSPFVVAFYGWTVVSCQLGFSWGSPGAVKGSCNMCNLQSQKLRAVHPCFASYEVHLVEKANCALRFNQNLNTSRHLKHQPQREKENNACTSHLFCRYAGEGISSSSGHTSEGNKNGGTRWQKNVVATLQIWKLFYKNWQHVQWRPPCQSGIQCVSYLYQLGKGLPGLIDLFNVNMSACSWHLAGWALQQGSERRQDVEIIYAFEDAT